jgi:hypothetical protein
MIFVEKPPKSVRGSLITSRLEFAKQYGLEWKEIVEALSPDARADLQKLIKGSYSFDEYYASYDHVKRTISGTGWYPASLYNGVTTALMSLMKKKKNMPNEETCRQSGRYAAEQHVKGFISYVVGVASIAQTINLVVRGWSGYYSEGTIRVTKNDPGEAQFEANIGYIIPELQYAMAGFFEVVLEKKGAKNVKVTSKSLLDKDKTIHFQLKWSA